VDLRCPPPSPFTHMCGFARNGHIRCIHSVFWQGNHQLYGYIRCIYSVFWQGNHQLYGHKRCIHSVFWQGNYQLYGHVRCIVTVMANPTHAQHKKSTTHTTLHTRGTRRARHTQPYTCGAQECVRHKKKATHTTQHTRGTRRARHTHNPTRVRHKRNATQEERDTHTQPYTCGAQEYVRHKKNATHTTLHVCGTRRARHTHTTLHVWGTKMCAAQEERDTHNPTRVRHKNVCGTRRARLTTHTHHGGYHITPALH